MSDIQSGFEAQSPEKTAHAPETKAPQEDKWTPSRNDTFFHGDKSITYGEWWDAQAAKAMEMYASPPTIQYVVAVTDYSGFLEAPDFDVQVVPKFKLSKAELDDIEQDEEFDIITVDAENQQEALEIAVAKFNQRIMEAHCDQRWTFGSPSVIDLSFDDLDRPTFEPRKATAEELDITRENLEMGPEYETEVPVMSGPGASSY